MSLLYKNQEDLIYEVDINVKDDGRINLEFASDCGKFHTFEPLAGYTLTPLRLLEILNKIDDYTDEELE